MSRVDELPVNRIQQKKSQGLGSTDQALSMECRRRLAALRPGRCILITDDPEAPNHGSRDFLHGQQVLIHNFARHRGMKFSTKRVQHPDTGAPALAVTLKER